jgi:hypothetical protein
VFQGLFQGLDAGAEPLDLAWAMAAGHGVDGRTSQIDPVWMIGGGPGMS